MRRADLVLQHRGGIVARRRRLERAAHPALVHGMGVIHRRTPRWSARDLPRLRDERRVRRTADTASARAAGRPASACARATGGTTAIALAVHDQRRLRDRGEHAAQIALRAGWRSPSASAPRSGRRRCDRALRSTPRYLRRTRVALRLQCDEAPERAAAIDRERAANVR